MKRSRAERKRAADAMIPDAAYDRLRREYGCKWKVRLAVVDASGELLRGRLPPGGDTPEGRRLVYLRLQEALRWGDAAFELLPGGGMVWIAPLMRNQRLLGGVTAYISRRRLVADWREGPAAVEREVIEELQDLLERENLTNASYMHGRRTRYMSDRRAAAAPRSGDFRLAYIKEEPVLTAYARRGEGDNARCLLNGLLAVLREQAGDSPTLRKSLVLEAAALMCRTAVEIGCDAGGLLGEGYAAFSELSRIDSGEDMEQWLRGVFERLLEAMRDHRNDSPLAQLQPALAFMRENLHRDIGRDEAAAAARLSPAHFSRLFKREMRESFTDMLNRMRVELAAEMLSRTGRSLAAVAADCGFKEQSYFTKVFRRYMRETPRIYRERSSRSRRESTRRELRNVKNALPRQPEDGGENAALILPKTPGREGLFEKSPPSRTLPFKNF